MSAITPLQAIYLLSGAGALVFFLAGWVAAGVRRASGELVPLPAPADAMPATLDLGPLLEQEREVRRRTEADGTLLRRQLADAERQSHELRTQVDARSSASTALMAERDSLRAQLEARGATAGQVDAERDAMRSQLDRLRAQADAAGAELGQIRQTLDAERSTWAKREQELGRELAELGRVRARSSELEQQLKRQAQGAAAADAKSGAASVEAKLRSELQGLRQQLATAERKLGQAAELGARDESLLTEKQDLEARLQMSLSHMQRAKADAEQARTEATGLRNELERARAESVALREAQSHQAGAANELTTVQAALREARVKVDALQSRLAELETVREKSRELGEEVARLGAEAQTKTSLEGELHELRLRLGAAESKAGKLGETLEENRALREELAELEHARQAQAELDRLAAEHKRLKLEHELLGRRAQELESTGAEQTALREQLAELSLTAADARQLRGRVQILEAELFAAGRPARSDSPVEAKRAGAPEAGALEAELARLLQQSSRTRTAVLADSGGLVIAGAGEAAMHEALAAWSGMAGTLADRACELLPLSNIGHVEMQDSNSTTLTCRFFRHVEELYAIALVGAERPAHDTVDGAIVQVAAAMSAQRTAP